ncbi:hypothetical protein EV715DRAFT_278462 [Schizophyllum commune]
MYSLILIVSLLPLFNTDAPKNRLGSQRRPQKSSSPFRPAMSPRTQATAMANLVTLACAHRHLLSQRILHFLRRPLPLDDGPDDGHAGPPSDAAVEESANVDAARHGRHAACTPPLIRFNHVEDDGSSDTPARCIRHTDFARRTEPNARPIPSTTRSRPLRDVVCADGLAPLSIASAVVPRIRPDHDSHAWETDGILRSLYQHLDGEMTARGMMRRRRNHAHFPGCRAAGGMRAAPRRVNTTRETPASLISVSRTGPTAGGTRAPPSAEGSDFRRGSLPLLTVRTAPTLFFRELSS